MRHLLLAALIAALPLSACETMNSPDRVGSDKVVASATGVIRQYARTWNDRDMTGFGALFATDARYVNSEGTFLRGRSAIVARHRSTRGRYADTARMSTSLRGARAITNDAIIAVMGMAIRDGARPEPIHDSRLTLTLVKREGAWVIAQAQASPSPQAAAPSNTPTAARTK